MNNKNKPHYPACEKLAEVAPYSQKIGEFLDWLRNEKGAQLCALVSVDPKDQRDGDEDRDQQWAPVYVQTQELLAEFFEIDMVAVEKERQAMLDALRQKGGKHGHA